MNLNFTLSELFSIIKDIRAFSQCSSNNIKFHEKNITKMNNFMKLKTGFSCIRSDPSLKLYFDCETPCFFFLKVNSL